MSGVYQIRNLINGKIYVGSAEDFVKRWLEHKWLLRSNRLKHHSSHLQHAWNKYGEEAFVFEILIHCKVGLLLCYEQKYIDFFCSADPEFGYNISEVAGSPMMGRKHSEETKKKMSEAHLGFRHSDESKKKMSGAQLGHVVSEEARRKLATANLGKKASEESKRKMSEAQRRRGTRGTSLPGEKNPSAKLTWAQIRVIRQRYSSGESTRLELAEDFGIGLAAVGLIINNQTWKDETLSEEYYEKISAILEKTIAASAMHGDKCHLAKLTWKKVREIREKFQPRKYTRAMLAEEYGVTQGNIGTIIANKTWKDSSPEGILKS